eukprot:scaffold74406_cov18-Prasinocladus_malaysianus.AAC.1
MKNIISNRENKASRQGSLQDTLERIGVNLQEKPIVRITTVGMGLKAREAVWQSLARRMRNACF